ncbi:MAG TPA: hypothetical protein VKZ53_03310 [Candidatus Angelobacter sp.]|nr:hypothetical protein [Candidatus Angelobacter sp.]
MRYFLFSLFLIAGVLACCAQQAKPQAPPTAEKTPQAQTAQQPQPSSDVPTTDGGAGPCTVDLTVLSSDGKPVFAALINVHIAYGFAGTRRLDMGVYTNNDGRARFIGIPPKVRKPPIEFRASKDQETGVAVYNPDAAGECQAKREIVLQKGK